MTFLNWSQSNPAALKILRPDLGIKKWDDLSVQEKDIIWLHFKNRGWFSDDDLYESITYNSISKFDNDNKSKSFCKNLLNHGGPHSENYHVINSFIKECCLKAARDDFEYIFKNQHQDVVYELISYYAQFLNSEYFNRFVLMFNDISNQFALNVLINENGFILKQENKITKEIYEPTLKLLDQEKCIPVNRDLADATNAYLKNSPEDYSSAVTLIVSALQAFLQILVNGKTGSGELSNLIPTAQEKKLIPNDSFSKKIFKDIESILMEERQTKGNPHPKIEYANENTTRLLFNLVFIFIQHCLQKKLA